MKDEKSAGKDCLRLRACRRVRIVLATMLSAGCFLSTLVLQAPVHSQPKKDIPANTQKQREVAVVSGNQARKILSKTRGELLRKLEKQSRSPVSLTVDLRSKAIIFLGLTYHVGSKRDNSETRARQFLNSFQALIDPVVSAKEYVASPEDQGCDDSVVVFDRRVQKQTVLGSRMTLNFSGAGDLTGVVNAVASVPPKVLPKTELTLTRQRIGGLRSRETEKSIQRFSVVVPEVLGEQGNLREANLVVWNEYEKEKGLLYKAAFEGMKGGVVGPFVIRDRRDLVVQTALQDNLPTYHLDTETGLPDSISYHAVGGVAVEKLPAEQNAGEIVYRFLGQHPTLFRTGAPRCQYAIKRISETALLPGVQFVRMEQRYLGLPVFGAELVFEIHDGSRVMSVDGHALPNIGLNPDPTLGSVQAVQSARAILTRGLQTENSAVALKETKDIERATAKTELGVFPGQIVPDRKLENRLAYKVTLNDYVYFIDAENGSDLYSYTTRMDSIPVIRDAEGLADDFASHLIYPTVWIGSGPTGSPASNGSALPLNADVTNLVATIKTVDSFYRSSLGRDSWDNNGAQYIANTNVALAKGCPGAGAYFSEGYNELFACLGVASEPDAIGHEFTHGVISTSSELVYQDQPGALNEAYADLFGNLIFPDNPSRGASSAWLIGEPPTAGGSTTTTGTIRDMQNPGRFGDPATMAQFQSRAILSGCTGVPTSCDKGGVHTNSGIINRAHTLLADGIPLPTPTPSPTASPSPLPFPTLGPRLTPGIGRSKLTLLAYLVMTEKLGKWSRFIDASLGTRNIIRTLVGTTALDGSVYTLSDVNEVSFAFDAVGLNPELFSGWGEKRFGFSGTEQRQRGETTSDNSGTGCTVANIRGSLTTDGSGDRGFDFLPSSAEPSSTKFRNVYGAGFVVPSGATPAPIGTTTKEHTISWFSIFGFKPRVETYVVENPPTNGINCTTALGTVPWKFEVPKDYIIHKSGLPGIGDDGHEPIGNASSSLDFRCNVTNVEIEMLQDDDGVRTGNPAVSETFNSVNFFNQTVSETRGARFEGSPPPSGTGTQGQTRNLSVSVRWFYTGYYSKIKYRLIYHIDGPAGVSCEP